MTNTPMIAGVNIATDEYGRFNLNTLHRASGEGANKAPAQWLRTQAAKALVGELEKETVHNCIVKNEGRYGGTFAHELLAIEYAGWISPRFRLLVNQTFLDFKAGRLARAPEIPTNLPDALRLAAEQAEKVIEQQKIIEAQAPKVAAHDRIAKSDGLLCLTDAAKTLGVPPRQFTNWLLRGGYIYKRQGNSSWIAYQHHIQHGLFDHKSHTYERSDGLLYTATRALVTPKGLAVFAEKLDAPAAA